MAASPKWGLLRWSKAGGNAFGACHVDRVLLSLVGKEMAARRRGRLLRCRHGLRPNKTGRNHTLYRALHTDWLLNTTLRGFGTLRGLGPRMTVGRADTARQATAGHPLIALPLRGPDGVYCSYPWWRCPELTLMSGALAAFTEQRARFEVIGASGAGMLVGLFTQRTWQQKIGSLRSRTQGTWAFLT